MAHTVGGERDPEPPRDTDPTPDVAPDPAPNSAPDPGPEAAPGTGPEAAPGTGPSARGERRPGVPLGRPLGVPMYLAPSWLFAAVLITYGIAPVFSEPRSPGLSHYALAAFTSVLLAASVLAHEIGHCAVSLRLGLPIKRVTLFLFGGVTEADREPPTPASEYLAAVAGPLVSILLGGVAALVAGYAHEGSTPFRVAAYVAVANGTLAALNLLPGLPLDGGRVLRAAVWHLSASRYTGTLAAVRGGQLVGLSSGGFGLLLIGAGFQAGFMLVLAGAFLWVNATAIGRRAEVMRRVERIDVRSLVKPALPVAASLPLAEALRRAVEAGERLVVVDSYGAPAGVISGHALAAVPEQRRPWIPVADVTRAIEPGLVLDAGLDGPTLLERMRATPATEYLVRDRDGEVRGILSAHDVARALDGGGDK